MKLTLLTLVFVTIHATEACLYCCGCGALSPIDPYVTVGGTLELYCSLDISSEIDSSDLYFEFNRSVPLSTENLHILDNQTVKYVQHNITFEDGGIYSCKIKKQSGAAAYVESQDVRVDYPLQNVTNFSCVIYDWDKELMCSWDLGRYRYPDYINVSVFGCNSVTCDPIPISNKNQTYVKWTSNEGSIDSMWDFTVNVTNQRSKLHTSLTFHLYHIENVVKPDPLENLASMVIDSTTTTLSWTVPRRHRDQIFKVSYQSSRKEPIQEQIVKKTSSQQHLRNITVLENLHPYTQYQVNVSSRPLNYSQVPTGFWSDPVSINFTTAQDVPAEAPKPVSFTANIQKCLDGYKDRSITVYWKEIEEEKRNGHIIYYVVDVNSTHEQYTKSFNWNANSVMTQATVTVPCLADTFLSIRAGTLVGFSQDSQIIYIPSSQIGLIPPALVMEESTSNSGIYIYWSSPSDILVQHYVLLWCYDRCQNDHIQMHSLGKNLNSSFLLRTKNEEIQVGLAVVTAEGSSGFSWNQCTYRKGNAPMRPEKVSLGSDEQGISVSWRMKNCDCICEFGYPKLYKIEWCKGNKNCHDFKEITISRDQSTHVIRDIEYDRDYSVRVTAMTRNNIQSLTSDTVTIFHQNPNMKPGEIVAAVFGGLFGIIFLSAGFFFIIRYGMKSVKNCLTKSEIQLPSISKVGVKGSSSGCGASYTGGSSSAPATPTTPDSCPDQPLLKHHFLRDGSSVPKLSNQISQDSGRGSLQSDHLHNIVQPVPELPLSSLSDYCKFGAHKGTNETSSNYRSCGEASSAAEDSYFSAGQKESSYSGANSSNFPISATRSPLEEVREADSSDTEDDCSSNITSYTKLGILSDSKGSEECKHVAIPAGNTECDKESNIDEIKNKMELGIDEKEIKLKFAPEVYNISDIINDGKESKFSSSVTNEKQMSDINKRTDGVRDLDHVVNHHGNTWIENSGPRHTQKSQPNDTNVQDTSRSELNNMQVDVGVQDSSSHDYDQSSSSFPYSTSTSCARYVDVNCSSESSSDDVSSPYNSSA